MSREDGEFESPSLFSDDPFFRRGFGDESEWHVGRLIAKEGVLLTRGRATIYLVISP